jgi:spore germination cell wall hydrolase CwlJ-like protein
MILDAITCIALAVYHEAGSDYVPDLDKHSVAYTVENRSGNRNQNHCEVIAEKGQFEHLQQRFKLRQIKQGQYHTAFKPDALPELEREAWLHSVDIAREVKLHEIPDPTNGAEYFHQHHVHPKWSKSFKLTLKTSVFKFYLDEKAA